jgi:hypothetical protein
MYVCSATSFAEAEILGRIFAYTIAWTPGEFPSRSKGSGIIAVKVSRSAEQPYQTPPATMPIMPARVRSKSQKPSDQVPFPTAKSRNVTLWITAVMVAVLLSVSAMFGLGVYLLKERANHRGGTPQEPVPNSSRDAGKKQ